MDNFNTLKGVPGLDQSKNEMEYLIQSKSWVYTFPTRLKSAVFGVRVLINEQQTDEICFRLKPSFPLKLCLSVLSNTNSD